MLNSSTDDDRTGYSHFSAHENAQTSVIPRRLMEVSLIAEIRDLWQACSRADLVLSPSTECPI